MIKNEFHLLPFRFSRRDNGFLITNEVGDFQFINSEDFSALSSNQLPKKQTYFDLKSKGFVYDQSLESIVETLATRYRTKQRFLFDQTSLHMFVVTLRCNQRCDYCHASSESDLASKNFDMTLETARKSVEFALQTPSPYVKFEFQGGESLLNFDVIKEIVEHSEKVNEIASKQIDYVVCTNLVGLTQKHLDFFQEKNIDISTSLDGPRELHDRCRKLRSGSGSYDRVVENMDWARKELGKEKVSALLTVTPFNLNALRSVIDEYIERGMEYIFIRRLNPFGYAYQSSELDYPIEDFVEAYKDALDYIIQINLEGTPFSEAFATILLSRILTPSSTGFVDLQSPTGSGLSGIIYDTNGDIYISDEARMMSRTVGDKRFCIGTVEQTRSDVFSNPEYVEVVRKSVIDANPGCAWCVYKPYCGSDPVRNFFSQGDIIGHQPTSEFCKKHRAIFDIIFDYLERNDEDVEDVFWSWITRRTVSEIRSLEIDDLVETSE